MDLYQSGYFTLILRYVPEGAPSAWHPTDATGPFSVLSCGCFPSLAAAEQWALKSLNGGPYELQFVGGTGSPECPHPTFACKHPAVCSGVCAQCGQVVWTAA